MVKHVEERKKTIEKAATNFNVKALTAEITPESASRLTVVRSTGL